METKKVLTFNETANYMGISKSCLYKMTMNRTIPHYKPNGKMIYFEREEVEAYLLSVRIKPQTEIETGASKYVLTSKNKVDNK